MGARGPEESAFASGAGGAAPGSPSGPRRARDPRIARTRLVLAAVTLACLAFAALTESPWARGVAQQVDLSGYVEPGHAIAFVWCGALVLAAASALLALTATAWMGPRVPAVDARLAPPGAPSRGLVLVVLGALLACASLAGPRLDHGLWEDEAYSARHSMVGRYRLRDAPGRRGSAADPAATARFLPVGWRETLWHYRMPNNHVPYSVAARLTATAWLAALRPEERLRIEVPLRLPAFACGLAAIPALALLLWRLGLGAAGGLAAWLLALHPWHVRYASEARGYALVILLVPLLAWSLVEVLRRGSWPHWLAFGAGQLLLLWVYPAALPIALCANAALLLGLVRRLAGTALRLQLARQLVVGVGGASLYALLMLPNLIQLAGYTAHKQRGAMGLDWWREVGAHLLAGMPWHHQPPHPLAPELAGTAAAAPLLFGLAVALALGALALGVLRLVRRHGDLGAGLAGLFLLPLPLVVGLAVLRGSLLHSWYAVFAVPGLVLLVAVGVDGALAVLARRMPAGAGRALRATACAGLVIAFAGLTAPMHAVMQEHTLTPNRDAVLLTRPGLDPNTPANRRILTASFVDLPQYYDPRCVGLRSAGHLRALMRRADREDRALWVNTGRMALAADRYPEATALVRDRSLFEPVAELRGLVSRLPRHVYRYRGAASETATSRAGRGNPR